MEEDKNYIGMIHGDLARASQVRSGMPESIGVMSIKAANRTILEASLLPETAGEDGSFYLEDLVGFTIFTEDGPVGEITGYDDSTDNLLFEVRAKNGSEVLVPAVGDMITEIDEDARTVTMDLPGGLFSL